MSTSSIEDIAAKLKALNDADAAAKAERAATHDALAAQLAALQALLGEPAPAPPAALSLLSRLRSAIGRIKLGPLMILALTLVVAYDHLPPRPHPSPIPVPAPVPTPDPGPAHDPAVLKLGADYRARLDAAVADQLASVATLEFTGSADLQAKFQAAAADARRRAWLPVADELTRRFGKTPDAGQHLAIREFYAALATGYRGAK